MNISELKRWAARQQKIINDQLDMDEFDEAAHAPQLTEVLDALQLLDLALDDAPAEHDL